MKTCLFKQDRSIVNGYAVIENALLLAARMGRNNTPSLEHAAHYGILHACSYKQTYQNDCTARHIKQVAYDQQSQ